MQEFQGHDIFSFTVRADDGGDGGRRLTNWTDKVELVSVRQACQLLGCSRSTLTRMRMNNELPSVNVRGRVGIRRQDLERIVQIGSVQAAFKVFWVELKGLLGPRVSFKLTRRHEDGLRLLGINSWETLAQRDIDAWVKKEARTHAQEIARHGIEARKANRKIPYLGIGERTINQLKALRLLALATLEAEAQRIVTSATVGEGNDDDR